MVRHCAVKDCNTDSRYLQGAKFFKFPGPVKKGDLRKQWIKNVNRINPDNTLWEPKKLDVVCYKHFVEGKPTLKYPVPQLLMGHQYVTRVLGRSYLGVGQRTKTPRKAKSKGKENKAGKTKFLPYSRDVGIIQKKRMCSLIRIKFDRAGQNFE